ncbi:hypothetical protein M404DRAFT_30463 [Pisolithus tinctorius Marx 270]|uniref:Uncharacterized protein n=1 Tax=Pisolithus tinctorius Marx 270 TaxID=870435 RepID=A0A0C3NW58_PISTI|nr:hypothetical protein M404DRAFT_30463 [Pisolithus tinctorius Marx 270]
MEGIQDQLTDLRNTLDALRDENYRLSNELRDAQGTIVTIEGQQNQWNALSADVIQRRIEVMADPGQYAGDRAKFSEWWVKMKVWVAQNRTTLPTAQDKCTAVWSCMTGPVAGRFAQAKFSLAIVTGVWPDTAEMIEDIDRFFAPQTDVEWAKAQMCTMRQGNSRYEEFYAKFESLKVQGRVTDETAGFLLENAIHPAIVKEALRRGYTQGNYLQMTVAFREAALARDRFKLLYNHYPDEPAPRSPYNRPSYSPRFTPTGTQPGHGAPMEIGAARFPPRPVPSHIKCFDCQGNHYKRDCPRAKGKGPARPNIREVTQEAQETALHEEPGKRVRPVEDRVSTGYVYNKFSVLGVDNLSTKQDIFNSETTVPSEEVTPVGAAADVKLPVLNSSCNKNKSTPIQRTKTPKIRTADPKAELELEVVLEGREKKWSVKALVDLGANDTFLDKKWADENDVPLIKLGQPVAVLNVDGTPNVAGNITHVTTLGTHPLILGYTWLRKHNPEVCWETKQVKLSRCPRECHDLAPKTRAERIAEEQEAQDMEYLYPKLRSTRVRASTTEELVPKEYHQYLKVFSKEELKRMPLRKPWDHAIDLKETFTPKRGRLIPLSVEEQKEVLDCLEDQLRKGYIHPSKSPQTLPVFFVPKKDGKKRMVQDYRYLNEHTVKNAYPLPLISQLVDKLKGCKLFTKMDLRWGYNNVRVKEGDEWKAAFVTHKGAYEPLVMYFGLCNSPSTFQNMMNDIFGDMEDVLVVYIDDLMIFTKTDDEKEHDRIVLEVLRRLEENDLFVKPEKCFFKQKQVEFLGMVVGTEGVSMDKNKVKAITEWPVPTKVRSIARPLNDLTRKDQLWTWGSREQQAFDALKLAFTTAPVLAFPDQDREFCLETDASDFATGAVLSVKCEDDLWRPVAFYSHSMSPPERNYQVFDKEMLAIIRALETWRHYLEATPYQFEIWTDHANLQYFMKAQNLDRRQARWAQYLSRFNYKLVYKPGSSMAKADTLSRREDHEPKGSDNQGVTLLDPSRVAATLVIGEDVDLILTLKSASSVTPQPEGSVLKEGLYHHDTPLAGHPGWKKTLELVSRNYVWPGMTTTVRDYVSACHCCQMAKSSRVPPAGKLLPNPIPERPWTDISVDFMELPEAQGFNNVMVVVDRFSKEVVFAPTVKEVSSLQTAELFRDHVWTQHGLPSSVISDRGPQFASTFTTELCKMLGVKPKLSTAFHPQTDGQTERLNQDLQQYLHLFVNDRQDSWPSWLKVAQFSYNNKRQESTGKSPFSVTRSYAPRMGVEPFLSKAEAATDHAVDLAKVLEDTKKALDKAAERMKVSADASRSDAPSYSVGDMVWLETSRISLSVELKLPKTLKIHPIVNISRVKPYKGPLEGQTVTRPGLVVGHEGNEEFEVDYVADSRLKRNKLEYLVHWKGYHDEDRTWEPESTLKSAPGAVRDFHRRNPSAPRKLRGMDSSLFSSLFKPLENFTDTVPTFNRLEVDF